MCNNKETEEKLNQQPSQICTKKNQFFLLGLHEQIQRPLPNRQISLLFKVRNPNGIALIPLSLPFLPPLRDLILNFFPKIREEKIREERQPTKRASTQTCRPSPASSYYSSLSPPPRCSSVRKPLPPLGNSEALATWVSPASHPLLHMT